MKKIITIMLLLICLCGCAPQRPFSYISINNEIIMPKVYDENLDNMKFYIKSYDLVISEIYQTEEQEEYNNKINYDKFIKKHAKFSATVKSKEIINAIYNYGKDDYDREIMLAILAKESKFYEKANSFLGPEYGRGIGQISEIVLKDYNWKNNTDYKISDLYNIDTNIKIAYWIFHYNELYGVVGKTEKIIAYNRGAGTVKRERDRPNLNYYYGVMELYDEVKS